jgi:hypothetical protein
VDDPDLTPLSEVLPGPLKSKWGPWAFDEKHLVVRHDEHHYEVPIGECRESAHALDWIAQVASKTWATDADVGSLVRAFDDLLDLQGLFCGAGRDAIAFDVRTRLRTRRERHDAATRVVVDRIEARKRRDN